MTKYQTSLIKLGQWPCIVMAYAFVLLVKRLLVHLLIDIIDCFLIQTIIVQHNFFYTSYNFTTITIKDGQTIIALTVDIADGSITISVFIVPQTFLLQG